jgi:DNA-binding MarR family transcriptional regulator
MNELSYLSFDLNRLVAKINRLANTYLLDHYQISFSRFNLLAMVNDLNQATQHQIAVNLQVSDAVVSRMLIGLKQEGLVTVEIDPNHHRKRIVRLTTKGGKIVHSAGAQLEKHFIGYVKQSGVNPMQLLSDVNKINRQLIGVKRIET